MDDFVILPIRFEAVLRAEEGALNAEFQTGGAL